MDLPTPQKSDIIDRKKPFVKGLAKALKYNVDPKSEYGRVALQTALLLLDELCENMSDEDTIEKFLKRD